MLTRYVHGDITWIDAETPTHEEVRTVMEEFALDPLVAEELLSPSMRDKVEVTEHSLYLVLHFPAAKHSHTISHAQEIDFVAGDHFIITTRYDSIDPLHKFSKVFEVNSILDRSDFGQSGHAMLLFMLSKLYRFVGNELEYLGDRLEETESNVFEGREKEMVVELSMIARDLLNFKQAMVAHRDVLVSLEDCIRSLFGDTAARNVRAVLGDYYRINASIVAHTDSLKELRDTNTGLLYTKQNEIMKTLTIMAFVTFPLTLLAAIFGMNTQNTPLVGNEYDFWILVGIMALGTVVFFTYFKYKNWL